MEFKVIWSGGYHTAYKALQMLKAKGIWAGYGPNQFYTDTLTAKKLGVVIPTLLFAGVDPDYMLFKHRENENDQWRIK